MIMVDDVAFDTGAALDWHGRFGRDVSVLFWLRIVRWNDWGRLWLWLLLRHRFRLWFRHHFWNGGGLWGWFE